MTCLRGSGEGAAHAQNQPVCRKRNFYLLCTPNPSTLQGQAFWCVCRGEETGKGLLGPGRVLCDGAGKVLLQWSPSDLHMAHARVLSLAPVSSAWPPQQGSALAGRLCDSPVLRGWRVLVMSPNCCGSQAPVYLLGSECHNV